MVCMLSLGRGRTFVKPTGKFSVELITYFRKLKVIFKEINWIKGSLVYLFIFFVVKPFLTNSQRFLN